MLDVAAVREQFPALQRVVNGRAPIFLDGPGGTQVPRRVIDAIAGYMSTCNANHGGVFTTSRESDAILAEGHRAAADFVNASSPAEIVFGQNMTSLTFHLSRSVGRTLKPGDAVVVTRLDHDANVRPWVLAAQDAGAEVRWVGVREDGTLDEEDLARQLDGRARLVALTCASNAIGTMPDVTALTRQAHAAGALVYLDAVHYAPHGPIDVRAWGCDFLACSAYKFFGPHVGILYGKRRLLESLPAYKLRPAPDRLPDRWMTGTQNHEGIAGTLAAVEYLADLGRSRQPPAPTRRAALAAAYEGIVAHERGLADLMLRGLSGLPGVKVHGIADPRRLPERVPTFSITHRRCSPRRLAEHLDRHGIFVWHGNFYALSLSEALGVEPDGMVRIGLLHYSTAEEVQRFLAALEKVE
jgi:cysteine desulfurase family protein (TIGR01976 family)